MPCTGGGTTYEDRDAYEAKEILCELVRHIEANEKLLDMHILTERARRWAAKHKQEDEAREAALRRRCLEEQMVDTALSKLTIEERHLLKTKWRM
jgi:hypothetical protein